MQQIQSDKPFWLSTDKTKTRSLYQQPGLFCGGDEGTRTLDFHNAIVALSQTELHPRAASLF